MQRPLSPNRGTIRFSSIAAFFFLTLLQTLVVGAAFAAGYIFKDGGFQLPFQKQSEFPVFSEAYDLLKANAYFELPEKKTMEYGIIRGMLSTVNDPHTVFIEPPQHELQSNQLEGKFGDIGVRLERDENNHLYLFPLPNSPAEIAGILDHDRLLAVETMRITPETTDDIVSAAIRGPVGEEVKISIGRAPDFTPIDFIIRREEVALPSVTYNITAEEASVGIVYINTIANTTPDEVLAAVQDLQSQGATHFIIDVRSNGGGLVEAGVKTARLFLKKGAVVEEQYRDQPVETFMNDADGPLADLPIVILVNNGTASSAEIFAGALKGQQRAPIIGTRTYGKDTIQLVFSLSDNSSMHITAAHWWVPGLEPAIGGNGIQPDITVDENADPNHALLIAIETVLK